MQLASWLRLDAHQTGVADLELNFRTPYLLAYPIMRVLAAIVPVLTALKLTFWASISLQAFTLRKLCERLGHDPWLGLLGFPLGLGYSFCFGFVAFCAALPLVYIAFAWTIEHRETPRLKSGAILAGTLASLLVAHGVALGFLVAVLAPVLLVGGGRLWQRLAPLAAPPLLAVVWLVPGGSSTRLGGDLWAFEPQRFLELPGQLVGIGSVDRWATGFGIALLVAVAWSLGRRRQLPLLFPLFASLFGYLLFPTMFRGAGPLGPRFSSYLVPALLVAFSARAPEGTASRVARRALVTVVSVGVALVFVLAPAGVQPPETAGLHAIIAQLPPGRSVRPIVFERAGRAFPGTPAHLHRARVLRARARRHRRLLRSWRCTRSQSYDFAQVYASRWARAQNGRQERF